jgi:hypothetical protein
MFYQKNYTITNKSYIIHTLSHFFHVCWFQTANQPLQAFDWVFLQLSFIFGQIGLFS